MLDSGLRLSHEVATLPTRVADTGKSMLKQAAAQVKSRTPEATASTASTTPASKSLSRLKLALIAVLSAGGTYLVWRFTHLRIGQLLYKGLRLILSCLSDAWRKLFWPLLRGTIKSCWRALVSR